MKIDLSNVPTSNVMVVSKMANRAQNHCINAAWPNGTSLG